MTAQQPTADGPAATQASPSQMELAAERVLIAQRALIALQAEIEQRRVRADAARPRRDPGLGKTLLVRARSPSASTSTTAHPVHARPDARRHPRAQILDEDEDGRAIRVPQGGAGVRERRARRRDQPRDAEDAVGAARGDAGAQVTVGGHRARCPRRSSCSRRRTRSRWRAPTRCPKRSSTASCSSSRSRSRAVPRSARRSASTARRATNDTHRKIARREANPRDAARSCARSSSRRTSPSSRRGSCSRRTRANAHAPDAGDPLRPLRGEPARDAGAPPRGPRARADVAAARGVAEEDVRGVAHLVLRHRMILSFDARLENVTSNQLVDSAARAQSPVSRQT
jgi:hypothetical protein